MTSTSQPLQAEPQSAQPNQQWSLCAGIDHYQDGRITGLLYAQSDAIKLHQYLRSELGYDSKLLRDPSATEFWAALEKITASAKNGDTVLVYFADHGNGRTWRRTFIAFSRA